MRSLLITAIVLAFPVIAVSDTIHVPGDQPTIQEGIDAAVNGDTVLVAPGTYVENIDFIGKAITVKGGGNAGETTIDGNQAGSVVVFNTGEGKGSVLSGFAIENGTAQYGGGIRCSSSSPKILCNIVLNNVSYFGGGGISCDNSSPTISNNTISGNSSTDGGGAGVHLNQSDPLITGNIIKDNELILCADRGGGIYCSHSSPSIADNIISGNSANYGNGGGICCEYSSSPVITNNIITNNSAMNRGGGAYCYDSSPLISGNTIANNDGSGIHCVKDTGYIVNNIIFGNEAFCAGGIVCTDYSRTTVVNNTVVKNKAVWTGGFLGADFSSPMIINTIIWGNTANGSASQIMIGEPCGLPSTLTISYSDVMGGHSSVTVNHGCTLNWGDGMIDMDPLFVDPAGDDCHLTFPSPCRDIADNSAVTKPYDFEGDPRIAFGTADMGADEFFLHLYHTGNAAPGASIDLKFVGLPGALPVALFYCVSGVLDPPIPGAYGNWYLLPPVFGTGPLGTIPSNGVLVLTIELPSSLPAPLDLYMQAIVGTPLKLTNLHKMNIECRF